MTTVPAGYTYNDPNLAASPVTLEELGEIKKSLMWTEADTNALRRAGEILTPHTEAILDVWYGFVGSNPHLVASFAGDDGQPDAGYLAAVRERFGRWINDLCTREFDETWLAYQEEIGLRHTTAKKNQTDGVKSPPDHVPLRHLIALTVSITVTVRDFLVADGADPGQVDAMYHAWFKAVTLSARSEPSPPVPTCGDESPRLVRGRRQPGAVPQPARQAPRRQRRSRPASRLWGSPAASVPRDAGGKER